MSLPSTNGITPYLQAYSSDSLDRLTSGPAGTYTYGDPNHLHGVTSVSDMPNQYASYDAMGNMTCRNTDTTSGHTCAGSSPSGATMTYDAQGRLSAWTAPSGTSVNEYLLYDNEGNLVLTRTVTPNGNTSTIDFGVTETVLTSSTTTTTNYYFVDGQRVAEQVGSTFSYLIPNLEGSPTVALSSTGTVSAVELFLPYGAQGFAWGTMPTPHNYTDQLLDSQSGLLYYGARWYDPLADQFTSADSVQGDPSGMDPYGYVGGNPETFVDPTGQFICSNSYMQCEETIAAGSVAVVDLSFTSPLAIIAASLALMWAIANQASPPPYHGLQPQPAPTPTPPSYPGDPFVGHEDSPVPTPMSPPSQPPQPPKPPASSPSPPDDNQPPSNPIRQLDPNKPVTVIGETMTRVEAATQELRDAGFSVNTYNPDPNPPSMEANRAWLRYWVDKGSQGVSDFRPVRSLAPAALAPLCAA